MTLRAEYGMRHTDLELFLAEPIWEEKNGSMLSILSAFARLGVDPWEEAARLAAMPRDAAAAALAGLLARLPSPSPAQPDHGEIARTLVAALPKSAPPRAAASQDKSKATSGWGGTRDMILLAALAAVLGLLQATGQLF